MYSKAVSVILSLLFILGSGFNVVAAQGGGGGFNIPALMMHTDAFEDGGIIPHKYTSRGENVQPGFTFSNAPEATVSYALVLRDIDVSFQNGPTGILHWVVWNIPVAAGGIPEGGLPEGAVTGANIARQNSYFGPGAPNGPRYHHYVFELYALNSTLDLPASSSRDELLQAITGKVVAKAAYIGRFRNGE
jgi:hypothetical protein